MRRMMLVVVVSMLSACHLTDKPETALTIPLHNTTGDKAGTAKLTEHPDGVKIKLDVEGLTPGYHGIHIHEHAKCDQPYFISSGNHLNPEKKKHGLLHPDGAHLGDLKNVEANKDGKVKKELTAPDTTLLKGNKSITDNGGTSLIITSEADDGMTQISGDAGERLVCGEIKHTSAKNKENTP